MGLKKTVKLSALVSAVEKDLIDIGECIDMHQFCAFWGAYDVFSYFDDLVLLVHGTAGCTANRHFLTSMGQMDNCDKRSHHTTDMKENDIIFGGEQKFMDSLEEVMKKNPDKNVAVLTNCCTDIIGDDVEGCIESLPDEDRKRVIFMNTGGYSGKTYRDGTENAFRLLAEKLYSFGRSKDREQKGSVNLFTRRWLWDPTKKKEIDEIKRDLGLIGLKMNEVFDHGFNMERLEKMSEADVNVSLCPFYSRGFFDQLRTLGGIDYVDSSAPIGLEATMRWLEDIARKLSMDISYIYENEEISELFRMRDELRKKIGSGRKCVIWNQTGDRLLSLVKLASELGMEPVIVGIELSTMREKFHIFKKEVCEGGVEAVVYPSKYIDEIRELVNELDAPVIFCNDNFFSGKKVFRYRFAHNLVYGLNGARSIFTALNETLDTPMNNYSIFLEK